MAYLSISGLNLKITRENIIRLVNSFKGIFESVFILLKFNPDVVVGFGSLTSVPVVIFAWLLRIETLIHEQNVFPGRANRLLAKIASRIAISFRETEKYFSGSTRKIALTGNPIRQDISRIDKLQALDFFKLSLRKLTLLVMGGSQGSQKISSSFLETLKGLPQKQDLQVVHLCGLRDFALLERNYKNLGVEFRLFSFLPQMQYAYSAADLVISRAGAATLSEIIFFKLPAIIIPYPYAYKHQLFNAQVLAQKGAAVIIEESQLGSFIFRDTLSLLISKPEKRELMRSGYADFTVLAADKLLSGEVISLASLHSN